MSAAHIDQQQVRRAFARAAEHYEDFNVLQRRAGELLFEHLELLDRAPERVLDVGAGTGLGSVALKRRYPKARVIAVDLAVPMLQQAGAKQAWRRRFDCVAGDASRLPLADDSVDLLHSNLCVQWIDELESLFADWGRVMRPDGLVAFTTFGPDTLRELRAAWAAADDCMPHVSRFLDMHDIGDRMLSAGLRDPVLEVTRITMTYDQPMDALRDLKGLGATNADRERSRGLTGRRRFARMLDAYESQRANDRIPATFELVTAHAFGPAPGQPRRMAGGGEIASFSVDALRRSRRKPTASKA